MMNEEKKDGMRQPAENPRGNAEVSRCRCRGHRYADNPDPDGS